MRAPVQADYGKRPKHPAGTIAWVEHEQAWREYSKRYGSSQSAERIANRGGFGWDELVKLLGHEPRTWEPR